MQEHCREQSLFPLKSCTTSHKAILWASCFHHEAAILLSWVCSKVRGQSECVLSGLCASLKSPQCVCVCVCACVSLPTDGVCVLVQGGHVGTVAVDGGPLLSRLAARLHQLLRWLYRSTDIRNIRQKHPSETSVRNIRQEDQSNTKTAVLQHVLLLLCVPPQSPHPLSVLNHSPSFTDTETGFWVKGERQTEALFTWHVGQLMNALNTRHTGITPPIKGRLLGANLSKSESFWPSLSRTEG